jgi:predicted nucleic acid-binding protein
VAYLLDTNVAWRRVQLTDPHHANVKSAIDALVQAGEKVYVTAQNLVEFRAVATRPQSANGLGLTPAVAALKAQEIEDLFDLLPETPAIYPQWRTLVDQYAVCGKQVHDARLVAVMLVHGVTHMLTLNGTDFQRFPGITVIEP